MVHAVVRRYPYRLLGAAAFALALCAISGAAFFVLEHVGQRQGEIIAADQPPKSIDPIETGSVAAADDTIGRMIEKLGSTGAARTR
jgi:hypothetical protein